MTTTIRLSKELKARVSKVSGHAGVSSHHFILKAIEEKIIEEELQVDFHREAEQRYAQIVETGEAVPWESMRSYLESHINSVPHPIKPVPRKLAF